MNEWIQVVGRFHPLVLHLPIGLLTGLAAVESFSLFKPAGEHRAIIQTLAVLTALSAAVAATTGFVLSLSGEFKGETVDLHLKLGIALALATVVTAACSAVKASPWPRRLALGLCLLILIPTGHLGGTITHGENFLFAPLEKERADRSFARPSGNSTGTDLTPTQFTTLVLPILQTHCVSCHGEAKQKGDLALHDAESLLRGGEDGPVVIAGNAPKSELIRRLRLPPADKDHMPPAAKRQPTDAEITVIEAWIGAGASMTSNAPLPSPGVHGEAAAEPTSARATDAPNVQVPTAAPQEALAALRKHLVHVAPIAEASDLLVVDFAAVAAQADDSLIEELLSPIRAHVADLSLARSKATDLTLPLVGSMPNLARLDLRGTHITGPGLAFLKPAKHLVDLILSQTTVNDEGIGSIAGLPSLRRVYLWKSGVTPEAIVKLRGSKPELVVDAGDRTTTTIAAAETEVKLTSDAAPLGQAAPTTPADLKPINAVCPVSGSPVDPKYAVVYKGKVVGFCCPNCPKEFWADPAKFEGKLAGLPK